MMQSDNTLTSAFNNHQRRRGMIFLGLASAGAGFALATQMGLNANFLAEEIGVSGFQLGLLESIRESCGILALLVVAVLGGFSEPVLAAAMLLLFAGGLSAYALAPNFGWVIVMSLIWSQGLHVWMPLPKSMAMGLAEPGRAGHRLGQIGAASAAGFLFGLTTAYILTRLGVAMRPLYVVAGAAGAIGAFACLGIPRQIQMPGPRLVFRRKYRLFYLLSFLEGWRKQIFVCFAGFLLVRVHGTSLETMLILWAVVQVIGYFSSPRVGKLIDRIGERKILIFYFSCLTLFFIGYAIIPNRHVLYAIFILDSAFFVFAMALSTYANRIAPINELTRTLSMGIAMNHAAAVTMPLIGGILWKTLGYQWAFGIGAVAAVISIGVAWQVPEETLRASV